MLVIACPGQGAQKRGFLTPWTREPRVSEHLQRLGDMVELDLVHYGTEADTDAIKDTAVAQPLIVAAGLTAFKLLSPDGKLPDNTLIMGHSVGEITASAIAGVLTETEAMHFVATRARAMAAAAQTADTGMSAILSPNLDTVLQHLHAAGITAVNYNGPGQIVAAGTTEQLAALHASPPPGARVIPLDVAGAFHSPHMASALEPLKAMAERLEPRDPRYTFLSNRDGKAVTSGRQALTQLIDQITAPVRWDLCLRAAAEQADVRAIELPPAGVLTGLFKRVNIQANPLATPDDLTSCTERLTGATPR